MPDKNRLIESLPEALRAHVLPRCELVEPTLSQTLSEEGATTKHVDFPIRGDVSLIAVVDDQSALEVGMVGAEGMPGVPLALGVNTSPLRSVVQGPRTVVDRKGLEATACSCYASIRAAHARLTR